MSALTDGYDSDEQLESKIASGTSETVEKVEEDTSLNNSDVCSKYQDASKIAMKVTADVAALCVPGANVYEICKAGNSMIVDATSELYKGKNKSGQAIEKGIAFPVCVSVNEVVAHMSPLASEAVVSIVGCDACVLFEFLREVESGCNEGMLNGTREGETLFLSGKTAVLR